MESVDTTGPPPAAARAKAPRIEKGYGSKVPCSY